jgi:hypothetical protein
MWTIAALMVNASLWVALKIVGETPRFAILLPASAAAILLLRLPVPYVLCALGTRQREADVVLVGTEVHTAVSTNE